MPSIVDLIITAVGTAEAAQSVGKVNDKLGEMVGQLGKLAASAITVDYAWGKLEGAISEAAAFEHLAARTGESVRELVVLDQAFRNAGLGAGYLGTAANLLDRALSPLGANATRNATIFRELGLSMEELRGKGFGEQINLLAAGFAKLPDQAARATVAMQLFGRYAGGQMLQLLSDPRTLEEAQAQAGGLADRIAQNAQAAVELQRAWNGVTAQVREMWQVAAAQLMPTLQGIVGLMGKFDLSGVGAALGMGGVGALGSSALFLGFDKIDQQLYARLATMEEGVAKSLVRPISNAMGDVALWTPIALGVAVAAQIAIGIVEAIYDARVQDALAQMRKVSGVVEPFRKAEATETTQAQAADTLAAAQAKLAKLLQERAEIMAKDHSSAPNAMVATYEAFREAAGGKKARRGYLPGELEQLDFLNQAIPKLQAEIQNKLANPKAVSDQIAANQLAALKQTLEPLVAQLPQLTEKRDKAIFAGMTPQEQIASLAQQRAGIQQHLASMPAGLSEDEKQAVLTQAQTQLLEIKKQEAEAQQKITEETKKTTAEELKRQIYSLETQREIATAAGNDELAQKLKEEIELKKASAEVSGLDLQLAKDRLKAEHDIWVQQQAQKDAREKTQAERTALENTLNRIRENLANLEADYTRTEAEKWADKKTALLNEAKVLQDQIQQDQAAADAARAAGNDSAAAIFEQSAASKGQQLGSVHNEIGRMGANPDNPFEQMRKSVIALRSEWGTGAEQIGRSISSVIGGAVQSVSQHITGAIVGTENWRQAFARIGLAIEEQVIGALVQMGVRYIATKLLMAVADKGIAAGATGAMAPIAMAQAAMWAVPATLATIASWGGAAAAAPGFIAASMALTQTMTLLSGTGFETGGFTGGREGQIAGFAHGEEFVFSAPATRAIGRESLEQMHTAALRGGPAPMPSSSGGSGAMRASNIHVYLDKSAYLAAVRSDMTGIAHEVYDKKARS